MLLENLARALPHEAAAPYIDEWLKLSPFDRNAHELLLGSLARQGRIAEGEAHLAGRLQTIRSRWTRQRAAARPVALHARETCRADAAGPALELISASLTEIRRFAPDAPAATRRASIAVMPFVDRSSEADKRGGAADALAYDVITRLAKLRSMFVIAQGTTFALRDRAIGPEEAGRMLNVDYVVSGSVRRSGRKFTVSADLIETRTARIVWAEIFDEKIDDALDVLDADRQPHRRVRRARNRNGRAQSRHPEATEFARCLGSASPRPVAHVPLQQDGQRTRAAILRAGRRSSIPRSRAPTPGCRSRISRTRSSAGRRPQPEIDRAFDAAGKSLMVDDRDPAAHWAMGRALWLRGGQDQAVTELERAVDLSPNYASAHYTLAFVHSQSGDPHAAISFSDHSRQLSPFDPLLFAMLGSRAISLARLGQHEEAAEWAMKAAARPNAHQHIMAIAAFTLGLAGRDAMKPTPTRPGSASAFRTMRWRTSSPRSAIRRRRRGVLRGGEENWHRLIVIRRLSADISPRVRGWRPAWRPGSRETPSDSRAPDNPIDDPSVAVIYWPRKGVS